MDSKVKFDSIPNPYEPNADPIITSFDISAPSSENETLFQKTLHNTRPYLFSLLAFFFGLITLFLVFDIISLSSIVPSDSFSLRVPAPAKRAVVFISDGTKADSLFGLNSEGKPNAPYIRSVIESKGSFGVSYAGLPTETRSCMTVLLAGHYLEFQEIFELYFFEETSMDHFLNESTWGWSFGSPEIIRLFHSTRNPPNIEIEAYNNINWGHKYAENERVFEQFMNLFERANTDTDLAHRLKEHKVTFLVHLVGVDTSGHTKGARDPDYIDQITFVDQGIAKAVELIDNFYGDKDTAYLLTADHGMKDTLFHTGDNPVNIRIPFVAWGAGIEGPEAESTPGETQDDYSMPWGFAGIKRKDVRQIDLAPMVAGLTGIPVPVNSEGRIQLAYIHGNHMKAEQGLLNAKQTCSQFRNREELWHKESYIAFFYGYDSTKLMSSLNRVEQLIEKKEYKEAQQMAGDLIEACEGGIRSMKNNGKYGFIAVMIFSLASWVAYSYRELYQSSTVSKTSQWSSIMWGVTSGIIFVYLLLRNSPWHIYLFLMYPLYLSYKAWHSSSSMLGSLECKLEKVVWFVVMIVLLDLLAMSFQRQKEILNVLFVAWSLAAVIIYSPGKNQLIAWGILTLAISYMISDDYIEVRNYPWHVVSWVFLLMVNIVGMKVFKGESNLLLKLIFFYTFLTGFGIAIADNLIFHGTREDLFYANIANFFSIPVAFVLPFVFKLQIKPQRGLLFYIIFISMGPYFLIQSLSYEVFLYCLFGLYVNLYFKFEFDSYPEEKSSFRRAAFFMCGFQILYQFSYYGFGNPATLDTFYLDIGFRTINKFSPINMGILQIFKIGIPYIILNLLFQTFSERLFRGKSALVVNIIAISLSITQILAMIWPKVPDYQHPKLSLSYPILSSALYLMNIISSTWCSFYMRHK